ncbi:hypothetical protein VNO78_11736 [Psophocarpus tetragonolobus]|uniref:Taxadien-5-alpha-ol O-acetyltransferase n=1 Tax=Psophocarpus tetragonolobus TaxID=3891 RepID=A0AAN9SMB7_PSOTE
MAYNNATLSLENEEVIFIKPSKATPTTILSPSTIDNDPENDFFTQSLHVYRSPNHISQNTITPKLEPAKVMKEALSKALFYYYPLAGKLVRHADGKLRMKCTSEGVPFLEATCNRSLSSLDYLDANDIEIAKHFGINLPLQDESGNRYPLVFKVTKFICGGFILAVGVYHCVCDGTGVSQFLRAVAELASGKTEPSVKPVWERERLMGTITTNPLHNPIHSAYAAVSPFLPATDFSHECSKVHSESIARAKMSLMKQSGNNKGFTTFEILSAYIWRARARALKLSYDGKTVLNTIVGVGPQLLDPLPNGYYGNTIVDAYVMITVRELIEGPFLEVVKLVRESIKAALNNDYIRHSIDSIETPKAVKYSCESGAITMVTDWRHLGLLEKVNFGWKEPVNTMPVPCDMSASIGLCSILAPSNLDPSMKGGVRVYVPLPSAAMPTFKEEIKVLSTCLGF